MCVVTHAKTHTHRRRALRRSDWMSDLRSHGAFFLPELQVYANTNKHPRARTHTHTHTHTSEGSSHLIDSFVFWDVLRRRCTLRGGRQGGEVEPTLLLALVDILFFRFTQLLAQERCLNHVTHMDQSCTHRNKSRHSRHDKSPSP